MPAVVKIDPRRRIVCSTFHGEITPELLLQHGASIAAESDFDPQFAEIADFSAADVATISETTLTALAGMKSLFSPDVPHVVVAPTDAMVALGSKYQELARESRPNLFVVRSLAEAYELLAQRGYGE